MDVDGLNDLQLQTGLLNLLPEGGKFLFGPVHSGGLVQQTHEACHAGNLFDKLQGNGIGLAAVPAEGHFHDGSPPFL